MRNPSDTLGLLPYAEQVGRRLRRLLERFIDKHPELGNIAGDIKQGKYDEHSVVFPRKHIRRLRREVLESLGCSDVPMADNGLCAAILRAYAKASDDPDSILADWLEEGAPIGITNPVENTGIFPRVDDKTRPFSVHDLVSNPDGWTNHPTAEAEPERILDMLGDSRNKGHGRIFDSWQELCEALHTDQITLNRFGLITKVKHNGKTKYRIIWDLKDSRVNELV